MNRLEDKVMLGAETARTAGKPSSAQPLTIAFIGSKSNPRASTLTVDTAVAVSQKSQRTVVANVCVDSASGALHGLKRPADPAGGRPGARCLKVLVVDDDPVIRDLIGAIFRFRWPDAVVTSAETGSRSIELVDSDKPEIVLLDIKLPDMDGFKVCSEIRRFSQVPIIMLTGMGAEVDKIKGLEAGADDYICKPFSNIELLARVNAVLRRSQVAMPRTNQPPYSRGDLFIDYGARQVRWRGRPVKLTPIEYNLLCQLIQNAGKVVTSKNLVAKVWGWGYVDELNTLKVHIQHLRTKLEDNPKEPKTILTERGVGYTFVEPVENPFTIAPTMDICDRLSGAAL